MDYLTLAYIKTLKKGTIIKLAELYTGIYRLFPEACDKLGYTPKVPVEEKWKNQIRWGLQKARNEKLMVNIRRGLYKRV